MNFGSHSRLHIDMALKARGKTKHTCTEPSEAFPVNDGWARLIVLSLGDPHLLEGAQGRKDRATNPHRVLALRWCHNLNLHRRRCQCRELLCHALTDACKHRSSARQHDVAVEILTDVHV